MFTKFRHSRKGFTLVELIVAMAILGIMSTMTLMIYFNISETSRRLQISREISETARQITERIAQEIKAEGIALQIDNDKKFDTSSNGWRQDFLKDYTNVSQPGSEVLPIGLLIDNTNKKSAKKFFVYGKKDQSGTIQKCDFDANNETAKNVVCGLFLWENGDAYNLVDAFREEEGKKRVRITDLKFYITGGDNDANKVTLKMTLELAPRIGVPDRLIHATKMEVQTTFSERNYKIQ